MGVFCSLCCQFSTFVQKMVFKLALVIYFSQKRRIPKVLFQPEYFMRIFRAYFETNEALYLRRL